jgi:hypothetical protein
MRRWDLRVYEKAYSILVWKPEGEYDHCEDVGIEGRIISKWSL